MYHNMSCTVLVTNNHEKKGVISTVDQIYIFAVMNNISTVGSISSNQRVEFEYLEKSFLEMEFEDQSLLC